MIKIIRQYFILEIIFNHIMLWNGLNYFSTLYFALKKMIKLTFGQESSLSDWAVEKSHQHLRRLDVCFSPG